MVTTLSKVAEMYSFTLREGVYIRLYPETAPKLFEIMVNTCRILDVPDVPNLYMMHSYSQILIPCGVDSPYLVISDYISEVADEDMLYYLFGNAITMIKAGHVEITNLTSYMSADIWMAPLQLAVKSYLHVADITSDRGGLLACQSFSAAVRCHMLELGVPVNETWNLFRNDDEAVVFVREYLKEVHSFNETDSISVKAAEKWMDITYMEGAANKMLREMYQWYQEGYPLLMKKYALAGRLR